jgi:YesN/AraC family two-component response regulator
MGKRRRRLNSPKFAKKYASVRATIAKLKGEVVEALEDGVVTPVEEKKIEKAVQQVVDVVKETQEKTTRTLYAEPVVEKVETQTTKPEVKKVTTTTPVAKKTNRTSTTTAKKATTKTTRSTGRRSSRSSK